MKIMPVYLITLHTYGSWLPDRPRGYVRNDKPGIQPPNPSLANSYRSQMTRPPGYIDDAGVALLMQKLPESIGRLDGRPYAVGIDTQHLHTMLGWQDKRDAIALRRSLKHWLSRHLNAAYGKRQWWSRGGSVKRVKDQLHFNYLITEYLPKHPWFCDLRR